MPADSSVAPPRVITSVRVEGNTTVDSARVLRTFEVTPGSPYSEENIRRGLRKLFALGLFSDASVERIENPNGVDLVIHVRERARIASIAFSGNKKRETPELERLLMLRVGEPYARTAVQSQVDSLIRFYKSEGFPLATVDTRADTTADGQIALQFVVSEGEKVRIAFGEGALRKHMKTKRKGLFGGGDLKPEEWAEDRAKLEAYYHSNGYRDMRVVDTALEPGRTERERTLVVKIEEGRKYWHGEVRWTANQAVDTGTLALLWKYPKDRVYSRGQIERTQGEAYAVYAERGYLYVGIEPRETVRDSLVDIVFGVTEGQASNVRYVNITGNHGTREHVIRREITIREGDRFKRSALVRTQGDLMRLGLFDNVEIDFGAADSSDVDINLKVKEKQVGTASAGAGYTSESGITGFLELGHNNVLGNAQNLSLHVERGAKRHDYFLSFTEPWFRGTPTLLGFTIFDTQRDKDLYEEVRVGGSARFGRPLPWPDYSRGSITYRIENVTINQLQDSLTLEEKLALQGIPLGSKQLTSSINLSFNRNSSDNPFYPTKGTRLLIESEFAGLGGSVDFNKHRLDARAYLPSALKRITTMIRGRFGMVLPYEEGRPIPDYERFRLGGGSTLDPLRGYDDYMVVPEKFIRDSTTRYVANIDTTGTADDTTFFYRTIRVRYPGGRFMSIYTMEQQFAIVHPLHALLFVDAGNTWDRWEEIRPFDLRVGAGLGFRMEIPLLGNIGFDCAYGFDRDDGPRWRGHFLIGNVNF